MLLRPICRNILEELMFNEIFDFFIKNKLEINKETRQFLHRSTNIYYSWIYSSFDEGLKVRSVFLDILKAFGKVWHDGIISKLIKIAYQKIYYTFCVTF